MSSPGRIPSGTNPVQVPMHVLVDAGEAERLGSDLFADELQLEPPSGRDLKPYKDRSPAAIVHRYCSRPGLKRSFERRRARALNPATPTVAFEQTMLRDTLHGAQLLRQLTPWVTRVTDCVFGTKRVRNEEGRGLIIQQFLWKNRKNLDVERVGIVGTVLAGGVVVLAAAPFVAGAIVGMPLYVGHCIWVPDEQRWGFWKWVGTCGGAAAIPLAFPTACVAEGLSEVSALVGAVPKVAIGAVGGAVGLAVGIAHGIERSRHVADAPPVNRDEVFW